MVNSNQENTSQSSPVLLYSMGDGARACLAPGTSLPVLRVPNEHERVSQHNQGRWEALPGTPSLPACGTHRGCSQGLLVAAGGPGETQGNIPSERLEWQTWIQKGGMHLPLLLKTFRAPQASYHMESSTSNGAYLDLSGNPRGAHLHPSSSFTLLVASCASQHTKSHTDTGSDPWDSPKKL